MKILIKLSIGALFIGIVIIATDFYLLWLPIEHNTEYPSKVAALFMAVTALVTLLLALVTVNATEQSNLREKERIDEDIAKQKSEKIRRQLNELSQWAVDITEIPSQITYDIRLGEENMKRQGLGDLWLRYNILTARIERIKILTIDFKEYNLDRSANLVIHNLANVMNLTSQRAKGQISDEDLTPSGDLLHKSSAAFLKAITKVENKLAR